MLKSFRYLLFPFALLYWVVIVVRNWMFDKKILRSATFNFPLICIGNLAVGGTGKTPMTEYLVALLKERYITATLSRGYKRKTKGYALANEKTTAIDIGDEPMQIHQKFPDISVAVGEERLVAIPQLLQDRPDTEVIILDDAFQHRSIRAGINILLTEFKNLYTRDFMMPSGDLRDIKSSAARADIIIVTKCKPELSETERNSIIRELNPLHHQTVYFTKLVYRNPVHLFNSTEIVLQNHHQVLLISGIANPKPLKEILTAKVSMYDMLKYNDHHIFTSDDLKDIQSHFKALSGSQKIILTTEKDGVRLEKFGSELSELPVYVIPVAHEFMFQQAQEFEQTIIDYVSEQKSKLNS